MASRGGDHGLAILLAKQHDAVCGVERLESVSDQNDRAGLSRIVVVTCPQKIANEGVSRLRVQVLAWFVEQ